MTRKKYTRPTATAIEMDCTRCIAASIGIGEGEATEPACAPVRRYADSPEDDEEVEWED